MITAGDRHGVLVELDAIERGLRTLLCALESPASTAESIEFAAGTLSTAGFDAGFVVDTFRGSSDAEILELKARLARLADLEAVVRDECQRSLSETSAAICHARVLEAQLDTLANAEQSGTTFDCVH